MKLSQRRAAFKRAVMDVFLNWNKTDQEKHDNLTRACIIAGLDPDNQHDRERLYGDIIGCRRGQYQWEMPLIEELVIRYMPSLFGVAFQTLSKIFR